MCRCSLKRHVKLIYIKIVKLATVENRGLLSWPRDDNKTLLFEEKKTQSQTPCVIAAASHAL